MCIKDGVTLSSELSRQALSYDRLRYEWNGARVDLSDSRVAHLEKPRQRHQTPVISLFSGCAGLDLGFEAAGFRHVALAEKEPISCATVRQNRPDWNVIGPPWLDGDISDRKQILADILETTQIKLPFEGVLVGGPPCQPFSIASNQRFSKAGPNFKRTGFEHEDNGPLLFDFIWLLEQLMPRVFLVENVPGLLQIDGGQQLDRAISRLVASGYTVEEPFVLNAADFGVPQYRQRLFVIGARVDGNFVPPEPSGQVPCEAVLRLPLNGAPNHITRMHKAESIQRYMRLGYGERDHLGRVDRLDPRRPSKTVIAGGTRGGGRSHLHPHIPRTLSVRECARLQTFPDEYEFTGPSARQFTQVGNAVPPALAQKLAARLYESYQKGLRSETTAPHPGSRRRGSQLRLPSTESTPR